MKVYYVNRADREDRHYLFRGAMAAMGFPAEDLVRVIAKNREDYPSRAELCEAGAADGFEDYFNYQRNANHPGYGCLVSAWSIQRCWRLIAKQDEIVLFFLDDYYLKQPIDQLLALIEPLDDLNVVQLAWHVRDDVFFLNQYNLPIPYQHRSCNISDKSPDFLDGAWEGASDWAFVVSPQGVSWLLDYMRLQPYLATETALCGMQHTFTHLTGIYSLRDQPRDVNGNQVLKTNPVVGHLVEYTDKPVSNLMGTHLTQELLPESELWDERMENPHC